MTQDRTATAGSSIDDVLATCLDRSAGIGFVGPDVPIDVLLASGRPFGHLPWLATEATPWADGWLESSFPFWARSILEQWHEGRFDGLDTVVFSRADDASQRLYYYVRELQQRGKLAGPAPAMFDIALVPRASSLLHTEVAVGALMRRLDVDADRLRRGMARANRLRDAFARIATVRMADGPWHERVGRAAVWSDATEWLDDLAAPMTAPAFPSSSAPGRARRRILLAGSVPPDDRLHAAVEAAGASVVAESHMLAPARLGPPIASAAGPGVVAEEPVERSLARHLRQSSIAPRAFVDRSALLVAAASESRADAVILWLTREDEAYAWPVPAQRRALAAAGLPALVLPATRWQGDDGALDRIGAFCREDWHATA